MYTYRVRHTPQSYSWILVCVRSVFEGSIGRQNDKFPPFLILNSGKFSRYSSKRQTFATKFSILHTNYLPISFLLDHVRFATSYGIREDLYEFYQFWEGIIRRNLYRYHWVSQYQSSIYHNVNDKHKVQRSKEKVRVIDW